MIRLTDEAMQRSKVNNAKSLLDQRKLLLVLDIDHTILHATTNPQAWQVSEKMEGVFDFLLPKKYKKLPGAKGPPPGVPPSLRYYVKIRPGFPEFLKRMKELFDIHVYTHAMRGYAEAICDHIDPKDNP